MQPHGKCFGEGFYVVSMPQSVLFGWPTEKRSVTSRYHGMEISGSQQKGNLSDDDGQGKKAIDLYKQSNNFAQALRFFCTFLSRCCTTATWKLLIPSARFYLWSRWHNTKICFFFFSVSKLRYGPFATFDKLNETE